MQAVLRTDHSHARITTMELKDLKPESVVGWFSALGVTLLGMQSLWLRVTGGRRDQAKVTGELDIIQALRAELALAHKDRHDARIEREAAEERWVVQAEQFRYTIETLRREMLKLQVTNTKLRETNDDLQVIVRKQNAALESFGNQTTSMLRDFQNSR